MNWAGGVWGWGPVRCACERPSHATTPKGPGIACLRDTCTNTPRNPVVVKHEYIFWVRSKVDRSERPEQTPSRRASPACLRMFPEWANVWIITVHARMKWILSSCFCGTIIESNPIHTKKKSSVCWGGRSPESCSLQRRPDMTLKLLDILKELCDLIPSHRAPPQPTVTMHWHRIWRSKTGIASHRAEKTQRHSLPMHASPHPPFPGKSLFFGRLGKTAGNMPHRLLPNLHPSTPPQLSTHENGQDTGER